MGEQHMTFDPDPEMRVVGLYYEIVSRLKVLREEDPDFFRVVLAAIRKEISDE